MAVSCFVVFNFRFYFEFQCVPVGWIPFVCCTQPGVVKRQQANVWAHCGVIVVLGPITLEMTCYYHHSFDNYIKLWRKETVCVCNLADIQNDIGFMLQTLQTVQLYRQHHVSFKLWSAIWLIDSAYSTQTLNNISPLISVICGKKLLWTKKISHLSFNSSLNNIE